MDITIASFAVPPLRADLSQPDYSPPRLTPARMDELDALVKLLIQTKRAHRANLDALREFRNLPENERIYVALASSDEDLLHFLRLSIAEAIDKLGWPDASAMVARWSKRRA